MQPGSNSTKVTIAQAMYFENLYNALLATNPLWLGLLTLVCYILHTVVYSLFFHPLAKHPGPLWARLSTIPSWWHTLKQDRHLWLFRLQERYGTTVRYRPDSVMLNTPDAFRSIFGPKGNNTKSQAYAFFPRHPEAQNTLGTIDNGAHGRKRRVLANAFSERALRGYEPYVKANLDRWCELLEAEVPEGQWSSSLNVADWMNWLVFDIMGDLCFSRSFGMKEKDSTLRYVIHLMDSMQSKLMPVSVSPIAPLVIWLKPRGLTWLLDHFAPADIRNWSAWVDQALQERTASEEQTRLGQDESRIGKDFFHYIFQTFDKDTGNLGYTKDELWEECQLLVVAGADTTAIVLAGLLFYLVRTSDVQTRLADEVLAAFDSPEEIAPGPKLQSCVFLRAVINEGLRMTPPVAGLLEREVLPGGVVIQGQYFPAGVNISSSPYCLGYNEDIFLNPTEFRPERWVVGDKGPDGKTVSQEAVYEQERALSAFSAGSRGCIGKNLAWMEMSLVLAKLLFRFEIRRDPSNNLGGGDPLNGSPGRRNPDQYQTYDIFVSSRDGPMVQLKKRLRS
ncbi:hypothetical protein N0V93_009428 [Gnomoniopsis smithogilvyi]|uniref:Benzoate 4-monooxygenase cytochrome P450 n=1 Tax=Gnomoniopsis smithogilvyi TaxID=1191159 RepID=A0A9W9CST4_9PEZI|nr:hypothetical protein N0V93_009428 [Gnomoniopsis smithogilvyi]